MARLPRPVMMRMSVRPAATASSTTYWIAGLSTTGSISLGVALVAGRNRVPSPATGTTALVTGRTAVCSVAMDETLTARHDSVGGARHVPAVATPTLGHVQRPVGRPHQGRGRGALLREGRSADRDRDVERWLALGQERLAPDRLADALGELGRALDRGLRQHHHELLAAVAGERVDLADLLLHPVLELAEHAVTSGVAGPVVDQLEVVEVQHQHGERSVEPGGPLDLAGQAHRQVAEVPQPGEGVGGRQPLRLVVQVDVVDGDAGLAGEGAQGVLVGGLE